MPDQEDAGQNKPEGNAATPANGTNGQPQTPSNQQPKPANGEGAPPKPDQAPTYKTLWKEIRLLDVVNTLIALGTLAVAFVALQVARDTSEMKSAVSSLGKLAYQTARQAKALEDQFAQVKRQADTQAGQLTEAQKQTKAISEQTRAIKQTSTAEIQSAHAQKRMADVTAQAQLPDVDLLELRITGLKADPNKEGRIPFALFWRFHNTGGSAFKAKEVRYGLSFSDKLPDKMPDTIFFISGADLVVTNTITSAFAPSDPIPFEMDKATRDGVVAGNSKVFFYAIFRYEDSLGAPHQKCFGRQIIMKEGTGDGDFSTPAGGPAYHCHT